MIFAISFVYARMQGPVDVDRTADTLKEKAEELIAEEATLLEREGTSR